MSNDLNGYVVFDLETTITTHLGRKASPFTDENWVVAAGESTTHGSPLGNYYGRSKTAFAGWFKRVLEQRRPKYLVGFNIKFDILHATKDPEDHKAFMQWIVDGGQIWDSQLVEYLLDGQRQESHMLSLDEVALRYGGELKIDEVKAMWAQGINTPDIPQQLLMDYLLGRSEDGEWHDGDIGNTEKIFLGQIETAKKTGQVKSIQLNNGALVATIEMERNGLYVDMEAGRKQAVILKAKSEELKAKLHDTIPKDLPFEYNWGSRKQISALIFGGRIKYKQDTPTLDEEGNQLYSKKEVEAAFGTVGQQWFWSSEGRSWAEIEAEQHETFERYVGGKKAGLFKTKRIKVDDHEKPKHKLEDYEYEFPGYTQPKPEWKTSEPGFYKTGEDIIDDLGGRGIQFLDDYADLKDIAKDLGTYYISEEFGEDGEVVKAKGMLSLVHADNLVHASISMVSTVTGRFAHSKPNVGNLPRSDTSDVKQLFVSRWGDDGIMMSSDFSSLEVYCQAILSGDKQLISDLWNGMDMHVKRLAQAEGLEYQDVFDKVKVEKIKAWINKRKDIKTFSFQRAYGAGAPKIARGLKLPVETVETWVVADDLMYPGIVSFNEKVSRLVKQSRVPEQRFVTHPTAKVQLQLGSGSLTTFDGKRYVFKENASPDFMVRRGQLQGFSPTELKNYPVQGLGGEFMKAAMWIAVRIFYRYGNFGGLALLVNTVHDALYADSHKTVSRKAGVILHASMLAASDYIEYLFGKPLPVAVPSETTQGPSMFYENGFEDPDAFNASANTLRSWIRDTFMDGYTPSFIKD